MQFDGTTLREPTDEAEFVPMSSGMEIDDSFDLYDGNADSPSGRYQARGTHPTTLTNLLTNTVVTLPMHSQGTICRDYLWSEDEHYLIALTGTLVSGGGCYTPVIGVTDDHGTLWRELGGCDWAEGTCMGWLPSQVDLRSLPAGTAEPVQLDPIRIEYEADLGYRLLSAPTDFRLICESDGSATIIDIESEETLFRLNDVECPYASYDVLPDVGLPIILAYDPVNELLATYAQDWETGVLIWQRQKNGNGYWNRVYQLNSQGYALEFSEDGSELRAGNFSGWKTFAVDAILERIQRSDSTD
jgi:hypothetical protein